jgi:hypothetical protein
MQRVLLAEFAVLPDFDTIGIVLFIFGRLVVTLFAFRASQGNANTVVICCHYLYTSLTSRKSLKSPI